MDIKGISNLFTFATMFKKILYITNLEVSVSVSASLPVTYPEKCGSDVALNKKNK